jgi:hypothetical protein
MKKFLQSTTVAFCGLVTSLLTAFGVIYLQQKTNFNLATYFFYFVVPVGAAVTGLFAACGYFLGGMLLNIRPTIILLCQMVLIAAFTQSLIYWLDYSTLTLEDGRMVASLVSFWEYMDITYTTTTYKIGQRGPNLGEVGYFGYLLGLAQFIGFMAGSILVYFLLKMQPACEECDKFFRAVSRKKKGFESFDSFKPYYEEFYQHIANAGDFGKILAQERTTKKAEGAINLTIRLLECKTCKSQMIKNDVAIYQGKEWKALFELQEKTLLPKGTNYTETFKAA